MERKIGEIFEYNGEWYQCVESKQDVCTDCAFNPINGIGYNCSGSCTYKQVIFKKLEKVGEPYEYYVSKKGIIQVQDYLLADPNHTIYNKIEGVYDYLDDKVVIEIKQNKEEEGMEEKKTNFIEKLEALCKKYNMSDGVCVDFISEVKEIIKDKNKEYNLKPFNLEEAKAGKPVCTRDGRKARIICFDAKGDYPIVALIETGNGEKVVQYMIDGHCTNIISQCCDDLMMLPEKKEG